MEHPLASVYAVMPQPAVAFHTPSGGMHASCLGRDLRVAYSPSKKEYIMILKGRYVIVSSDAAEVVESIKTYASGRKVTPNPEAEHRNKFAVL